MEVAQSLLAHWGGVAGLAQAGPEELAAWPGVGPAKAARLVAAFALVGRLGNPPGQRRLDSSENIAREAIRLIGQARTEQVLLLVADGGLRLKRTEIVASGTAKSCPMPVRELLAAVLRHGGVAFAVAHNHPGGDVTATDADRRATEALARSAEVTGLRFLDHVVVTDTDWRSASAAGLRAAG